MNARTPAPAAPYITPAQLRAYAATAADAATAAILYRAADQLDYEQGRVMAEEQMRARREAADAARTGVLPEAPFDWDAEVARRNAAPAAPAAPAHDAWQARLDRRRRRK